MNITVIIPVHNGGEAFRRCLEGIAGGTLQPDELIVVPDGESDGSWRVAHEYGARVLEPGAGALGPAAARNRGAEAAESDLLVFVDADVIVREDCLERILHVFTGANSPDALIGSYDDEPDHPSFLSQYRNLLHHHVHQTSNSEGSTFWGACGAVKRDVFLDVGGFDPVRFAVPSVEDIELGYRLRKYGATIRLDRDVQVKHLKQWTAASIVKTDFFCRAIPWTRLIHEHDAMDDDLNLRTESRISVALSGILALSIPLALMFPVAGAVTFLVSAVALLGLNRSVYRFFFEKRGFLFTLGVIPWHWFYYFYSGIAYVVGTLQHVLSGRSRLGDEPIPA